MTRAVSICAALLIAGGIAVAETTTPVGYVSSGNIHQGFNIVGITLHRSAIATGALEAVGADFVLLDADPSTPTRPGQEHLVKGYTYILEILSGDTAGVIQEIAAWEGPRLSVPENLSAVGVKAGDRYVVRRASTLNDLLDPRFIPLKSGETPDAADLVLIPEGDSIADFRRCFLLRLPGEDPLWMDAGTLKPAGDLPLIYPDGLIIHRRDSLPLDIQFSGEVKEGPTRSVVRPGFNLIATPGPVASTLQALGLENDLQKGGDPSKADLVWLTDSLLGGSSFRTFFLDPSGAWRDGANGEPVTDPVPAGSAILVQRKGKTALFTLGD